MSANETQPYKEGKKGVFEINFTNENIVGSTRKVLFDFCLPISHFYPIFYAEIKILSEHRISDQIGEGPI